MSMYAEFCPNCAKTGKDVEEHINDLINEFNASPERAEQEKKYFQGYSAAIITNSSYKDDATKVCPYCGTKLVELPVTKQELLIIDQALLPNYDYCYRDFLIEIKKSNPEEFQKRIQQLKNQVNEKNQQRKIEHEKERAAEKAAKEAAEKACVPKCPTCGSTKVERINGARRWLSVGLFGRASSDLGKTMHCKNCDYKW